MPFVMEFYTRMALKELGYTDNLDDLDCLSAEAFSIIAKTQSDIEAEKEKSKRK